MQLYENPLVIEDDIGPNARVTKIIVDTESSVDILFLYIFTRVGYKKKNPCLTKGSYLSVRQYSNPSGGDHQFDSFSMINHDNQFMVVDQASSFNSIIGSPTYHELKEVPSSLYQCLKYPVNWIIATVFGK